MRKRTGLKSEQKYKLPQIVAEVIRRFLRDQINGFHRGKIRADSLQLDHPEDGQWQGQSAYFAHAISAANYMLARVETSQEWLKSLACDSWPERVETDNEEVLKLCQVKR